MKGLAPLIQDPLVVLDRDGVLLERNRHAVALLGACRAEPGRPVFEFDRRLRSLIEAASGSSEPVMGSVMLRPASGEPQRFRVRALVLDRSDPRLPIAVQILDTREDQFTLLSRRVDELNREIAHRRATQVRLEDSIARNGVLYSELQHRVKNHLQMMLSLFAAARRETTDADALAVLSRMEAKLQAVTEAQRLMYSQDSEGVPADRLLDSIAGVVAVLAGDRIRVDVVAKPVNISNDVAFPLALIANELLSNAVKYGVVGGRGRIVATLEPRGGELELEVRDWGPGFAPSDSPRRSSGLGLVRGLCRQIGGRIDIESDGGTLVRVSFPPGG